MGDLRPAIPVLPIVAAFSGSQAALEWARGWVEDTWGPIALESPPFDFCETRYYAPEMGNELRKVFFVPERLADPKGLANWKLCSNAAETRFGREHASNVTRPLNLDPGYLSESKLILASTKDHAHRIYLGQGIYAEITLRFVGKRWQAWEWTYPDYRRADYHAFLVEAREYLRTQLSLRSQLSDGPPIP